MTALNWIDKEYNMAENILGHDDLAEVAFVRNHIPQEIKEVVSDDDLIYFGDLIYDFFDSRGLIGDEDDDEVESEFDYEELLSYVIKSARKDEVCRLEDDQIAFIIQAELAYYDSLGE